MEKFSVNTSLGENVIGGYVLGFGHYEQEEDIDKNIFSFDLEQYDLSDYRMGAYKLKQNGLEFDTNRYQEILEEIEQQEHSRPLTWEEKVDAQITYTAMMTDTLLEE